MPKRKRDTDARDNPEWGFGRGNARGGAGRGQGRKAAPRPFAKAAVARAEQTAPEQKSISELLGMRKEAGGAVTICKDSKRDLNDSFFGAPQRP